MDRYCQFFDSVIVSILVSFNENCSIEFMIRCRDLNNEQKLVRLNFVDVQGWSFLSSKREAAEVITEGVRIELLDGEWLVDFGDDPDVDLGKESWTKDTNKWIIAKGIEVSELNN
jgi:hypothetical protein